MLLQANLISKVLSASRMFLTFHLGLLHYEDPLFFPQNNPEWQLENILVAQLVDQRYPSAIHHHDADSAAERDSFSIGDMRALSSSGFWVEDHPSVRPQVATSRAAGWGNTLASPSKGSHTYTHTQTYGQFSVSNSPLLHVFGLGWRTSHTDSGRTCTLHTERPPGSAGIRTRDLLTCDATVLPTILIQSWKTASGL